MREIAKENVIARICGTGYLMGSAAARAVSQRIRGLLESKESVNIIFTVASSQDEFITELKEEKLDWRCINVFQSGEFVGLEKNAPQRFENFFKERLFDTVRPGGVYYLNGNAADPEQECRRYSVLLKKYPADIVVLDIGENMRLGFNDPCVADFYDLEMVKVVDLNESCRKHRVNECCFATLDQVPQYALALTIPALLKAQYVYAVVPGKRKANAIYHTLNSEIGEIYPSTILRRRRNVIFYLDEESSAKL